MDTSVLEDIGLTNAEIKVYLTLLEFGSSTAGPVLDKSGLQNSVVHMALHRLVEKGLVSYIKKGKIKHYNASNPRNIIKFIEEKKNRLEELLPQLIMSQKKQEIQEAEIFEGFKGFKNAYYQLIENAKKGEEYLFFSFYSKYPGYDNVFKFFNHFEKERKRLGIPGKGIVMEELKEKFKERDMKNLLFVDFPIITNVTIYQDKIILNSPGKDKFMCFLICSQQLADSFRDYWHSIWKRYKKS